LLKLVTGGRDVAVAATVVGATLVGATARVAVDVGCAGTVVATGGVAEGLTKVGMSVAGIVGGRGVAVGRDGNGAAQAVSVRAIINKMFRAFMVSSPVSWIILVSFDREQRNKIG